MEEHELVKLRAQAHFSEYQAMMARGTFWMSMQFMPLAPLVAFFALVCIVTKDHQVAPELVAWGTAGVTQVAILVYYFSLHEVYNHARFIEMDLKPDVAALLEWQGNKFWGWERHLKDLGKAFSPAIGDQVPIGLSCIALIAAMYARWCPLHSIWDGVGLTATVGLFVATAVLGTNVVKVRKQLQRSATNHGSRT
jgi:hypothetical protein